MSGAIRVGLLVVAAQAALVAIYLAVEARRADAPGPPSALGTAPPTAVDHPMPCLDAVLRDGTPVRLPRPGRATLLHVWATWCPPCRAELPALLALPGSPALDPGIDVVALALDPDWASVDAFLDGRDPARVARADRASVSRALDVHDLPVTFLVAPDGRLVRRFDGARDWADRAFAETHLALPQSAPDP